MLLILMLPMLALAIFLIVSFWKLYEKLGEAGCKSIIPIYNSYTLYRKTWKNKWWIPFFIPLITTACQVYIMVLMNSISVPASLESVDPMIVGVLNSVVSIALTFITNLKLYKGFGKGVFFSILGTIFPAVTIPMCAFGSCEYSEN